MLKFESTGKIRYKNAMATWKKRYDSKLRGFNQNTNAHHI